MGYPVRDLAPGSLYMTISIPETLPCAPRDVCRYHSSIPEDFDPDDYETSCADGRGNEEFDWGIYWHRGPQDGSWYTLARDLARSPQDQRPLYSLVRHHRSQSPHLSKHVVGLIRMLHVPGLIAHSIRSYLDWLADCTAPQATRSFMWATSLYLRTWRHISRRVGVLDSPARRFEVSKFLWEALDFAYGHVWYALGGQLPRPIMSSDFCIAMVAAEEELGREDEREQAVMDEARRIMEDALSRKLHLATRNHETYWVPKAHHD